MVDARTVDPELQRDTDRLILEYLVHNATRAVLGRVADQPSSEQQVPLEVTNHLHMVESYLAIVRHTSLNRPAPSDQSKLSFRLKLLQFTCLFTLRRASPRNPCSPTEEALAQLRLENSRRSKRWRIGIGRGAFPSHILSLLQRVPNGEPAARDGSSEVDPQELFRGQSTALLDIVPMFVELTVMRAKLGAGGSHPVGGSGNDGSDESGSEDESGPEGWTTSPQWLKLAAELMLHAALDKFAVSHDLEHRASALAEAFAWGPGPWSPPDQNVHTRSNADDNEEDSGDEAIGGVDGFVGRNGQFVHLTAQDASRLEHDGISSYAPDELNSIFDLNSNFIPAPAHPSSEEAVPAMDVDVDESAEPDTIRSLGRGRTWRRIRREFVRLAAGVLDRAADELHSVMPAHPLATFESRMVGFLASLLGSLPAPLLAQLERASGGIIVDDEDGSFRLTAEQAEALRSIAHFQ